MNLESILETSRGSLTASGVTKASPGGNCRYSIREMNYLTIDSSCLKVTGLGTALKILFSGEFDKPHPPLLLKPKGDLKLTRNEIVALFNSFAKLSQSIVELERFRELLRKKG